MIQATVMRSSMTGPSEIITLVNRMNVLRPALARRGQIAAFSGRSFRAGWLIITPRSHASRNREEPESFNADAHRLTFAPRVFFLEDVRVDWERGGPSRELVPSRPGGAVRGRHHRADLLVAVASCDRRQDSLAHAVAKFTKLAAGARV